MPSLAKMATEAKAKRKSAAAAVQKKAKKSPPPKSSVFRSAEYVEESDDAADSSSNEEEEQKPVQVANGNGNDAQEESSTSETETSSEEYSDDEEEGSEHTAVLEPVKKSSKPAPSSTQTQNHTQNKRTSSTLHPSYKPLSKPPQTTTLATSQLFRTSNLAGKQIWHITAPSNVPITSVPTFTLHSLTTTSPPTITHQNETYTLTTNTPTSTSTSTTPSANILLTSSNEGTYTPSSHPITRTIQVKRHTQLAGVTTSEPSPTATIPREKPVRAQPKGLRMRFLPIGVSSSKSGEEIEEQGTGERVFQVPEKIDGDSDVEMQDASEQKDKKKRKKSHRQEQELDGKGVGETEEEERKRRKKEKKEKKKREQQQEQ